MTPSEMMVLLEAERPQHVNGIHVRELDKMMDHRQRLIDEGLKVA